MRILVLADIHGNWPALRALDETYDVCLVLGDLVEYGLEAEPCIAWVRQHAHYVVRGNHDHGLAQDVVAPGQEGYRHLTALTRRWCRARLLPEDRRYLSRLPLTQRVTLEGVRFFLVHATPRDPLDEWAPADVAFWSRRLRNVDADVICVGHTHWPYVLQVEDKLVLNPGSVGQPRDGDPRASYALIEDNRVELRRRAYPVEETIRRVAESDLPAEAKELLCAVFRQGELPRELRARNGAATE